MKSQTLPTTKDPRRDTHAVRVQEAARNRKLAPLDYEPYYSKTLRRSMQRPVAKAPFCSSTYASIDATCPDSCRFKDGACYVRAGFTGRMAKSLDLIAFDEDLDDIAVAYQEAALIADTFGGGPVPQDGGRDGRRGRDLRLHVGGDFGGAAAALVLRKAARRWRARGGGAVWAYTHRWRTIHSMAFRGAISCLASVESGTEAAAAIERGYVPAVVVDAFPATSPAGGLPRFRAFELEGMPPGWKVLPCPAETHGRTCVECRLCLDAERLFRRKTAIGFRLHGLGAGKVSLPVVQQQSLGLGE